MRVGRDYPRLSIEEFGRLTIEADDLDPVYGTLVRLTREFDWSREQMARWLVAYWCTYHCGLSCWMSERAGESRGRNLFWHWLAIVARNRPDQDPAPPFGELWPRAPERRHWRAQAAEKCVADLSERFAEPVDLVDWCAGGDDGPSRPEPYEAVRSRTMRLYAFGPWIAYKVADMLDRVWGVPVKFTEAEAMYEEPRRAALMVWRERAGVVPEARIKDEPGAVRAVVEHLKAVFRLEEAPGGGRLFGLTEAETVLCKWKSHVNGHYPLGHDLREIRTAVVPWAAHSLAASQFLVAFPRSVEAQAEPLAQAPAPGLG